MGNDERTAKAVGGAFSFHPGLWKAPLRVEGWVCGPTFAVYLPEEEGTYEEGPAKLKERLESLIAQAGGDEVKIDERPHVRLGLKQSCKSRYVFHGERLRYEIRFPLVALARRMGVVRQVSRETVMYGYDKEGKLVSILAGKLVREGECGDRKVKEAPKAKAVSSRQGT